MVASEIWRIDIISNDREKCIFKYINALIHQCINVSMYLGGDETVIR